MDKYEQFRQFISDFISGPNATSLVEALADEAQKLADLSVAVTDQLTICTASSPYLPKKLAEKGITAPPDLGISDLAFRELGIQINAQKKLTDVIHKVLEIFYGSDAVRAYTISSLPEPYPLTDGMDLIIQLEDGIERQIVFRTSDFIDINSATAGEVADVITRFVRDQGLFSFATTYIDPDTNFNYVKIYGGARGPYSTVEVHGGAADVFLEFPTIRPTDVGGSTTWQVTKTVGSTYRFRWVGGLQPILNVVFPGDLVLMYGANFTNLVPAYGPTFADSTLAGTYTVTAVSPAVAAPDLNYGWFEIINNTFSKLRSTKPGATPSPNVPGSDTWYSLSIPAVGFDDLKFARPVKALPNGHPRYALAWEPTGSLLKIYMPATTNVVARELIGASHVHMAKGDQDFNGAWGSMSNPDAQIEVLNEYAIKYAQSGYDNIGFGGTLTYAGHPPVDIDYIFRENGFTTVICKQPTGITSSLVNISTISQSGFTITVTTTTPNNAIMGNQILIKDTILFDGIHTVASIINPNTFTITSLVSQTESTNIGTTNTDIFGRDLSTTIVTVIVNNVPHDDLANPFLGPYVVDPEANYTLESEFVNTREQIFSGSGLISVYVDGSLPNKPGILLIDLNKDTQEGPIKYIGSQTSGAPQAIAISSISQNGFTVTCQTVGPHGAIPGSTVVVSGTTFFNGSYTIQTVPNTTTWIAQSGISQVHHETSVGTSTVYATNIRSTILLDPSYQFKFNHAIGSDLTLLSDRFAYTPDPNGTDYGTYITGVADGRVYAQEIINDIVAFGINLQIIIVYPNDEGWGNAGDSDSYTNPPTSEKVFIYDV